MVKLFQNIFPTIMVKCSFLLTQVQQGYIIIFRKGIYTKTKNDAERDAHVTKH